MTDEPSGVNEFGRDVEPFWYNTGQTRVTNEEQTRASDGHRVYNVTRRMRGYL